MIRFLYNLLWPLGLLFFLPGYLVKMIRRGGYREKFGQRLGIYDVELRAHLAKQQSTWLHAVSVGEVTVALKLAKLIRALEPDLRCVLTTTTTTGFAFANENASGWIDVLYTPLDFWPIIRRAFAAIRPVRIILVEAEVWPNLAAAAHARRIPLVLVNARLSPRSEKRFRRSRFFIAPTLRLLDMVCVPEPEDVGRWSALGVKPKRIHQVGSIKYDPEDVQIDPTTPQKVLADFKIENRTIIFGGSTHRGEEEILAKIFRELHAEFTDLFLVIAPRHAERAREVYRVLEQCGLRVALRSQLPMTDSSVDCLLLDSTGELRNWYAIATIAFVGKSLTAHGGQNPAEAIVAGRPVVFGPHMENFAAFARALVAQRGAIQINSASELRRVVVDLLGDPAMRKQLVENGQKVLAAHRGATGRTAALIVGSI